MAWRLRTLKVLQDNADAYQTEPVTLQEAKDYLQVEGTAYDDTITAFIVAARKKVEDYTNVSLVPKQIQATVRVFNYAEFPLPYVYPDEIESLTWRKCPSTQVALVENTDYFLNGEWVYIPEYKGDFVVTYTTQEYDGDMGIFKQAIKSLVKFMYNPTDEVNPTMPNEVKALLAGVVQKKF